MNIDFIVVLFCLFILTYACWSDIRTRSVSNAVWLVLMAAGIGLLIRGAIISGAPLLAQAAISVLLTLVMAYLFFRFSLFGAADAKCLISLAVLFPVPPSLAILSYRFPLFTPGVPQMFPFALSVLMNAAILSIIVPLLLFSRNLVDIGFARCWQQLDKVFISYRLPIAQLSRAKHVRLVSPVPDREKKQQRKLAFGGIEINDEVIRRLENYQKEGELGKEVWVTPELPFIVPITAGFLLAVLVGNLLVAAVFRN